VFREKKNIGALSLRSLHRLRDAKKAAIIFCSVGTLENFEAERGGENTPKGEKKKKGVRRGGGQSKICSK